MPLDLRLGSHRYDLAHRALVIATFGWGEGEVALLEAADGAVGSGADVLEVTRSPGVTDATVGEDEEVDAAAHVVEALTSRFDLPVVVRTGRAEVLRAAAKAGAVAADDPSGFADPAYLPAAVDLGLTVVAHAATQADPESAYARAVSAGLRPEEAVLAAPLTHVRPLAVAGHRVMVPDPGDDPGAWPAVAALAVTRGARLVRTADVEATVRVVRMLERILSA